MRSNASRRPVPPHPGWAAQRPVGEGRALAVERLDREAHAPALVAQLLGGEAGGGGQQLGQAAKGGRLARAGPGLYEQSRRHRTSMMRRALNSLSTSPTAGSRRLPRRPASTTATSTSRPRTASGCTAGWSRRGAARAHVLLLHGNAGNVGDRVLHAALLSKAGFDALLFDYRGYGRSTGSPSEEGTYRDARAARKALPEKAPVIYLGESLGGAVALALARELPPAGLVLQSTFTSVRDMAVATTVHPGRAGPRRLPQHPADRGPQAPLLVSTASATTSFSVPRPGPVRRRARAEADPDVPDLGHNDLVPLAGEAYAEVIAAWARRRS